MHATPEDLRAFIDRKILKIDRLDFFRAPQLAAFDRLCSEVEPNLVFSDASDRVRWIDGTGRLRYILESWKHAASNHDLGGETIHELVELAEENYRGPSSSPIRELPFVEDERIKAMAERDLASHENALKAEDYKVAIIMGGCVVEAVLLDALKQVRSVPGQNNIDEYRAEAAKHGILDNRTERFVEIVKRMRNLLHANQEYKETEVRPLAGSDAKGTSALVDMVIECVQAWHAKRRPPS